MDYIDEDEDSDFHVVQPVMNWSTHGEVGIGVQNGNLVRLNFGLFSICADNELSGDSTEWHWSPMEDNDG